MQDPKNEGTTCTMTVAMRPHTKLDALKGLVPPNNFVTKTDIIPGLHKNTFPLPSKDPKSTNDVATSKTPRTLYVHNVEVCGSPKLEKELENAMARMYSKSKITTKGMMQDPDDFNAYIIERKVNVRVHNSWMEITNVQGCSLDKPDNFGIYKSSSMLSVKNFIPSE